MKRRGKTLVNIALKKNKTASVKKNEKLKQTAREETNSPVPKGNEEEVNYLLETLEEDLSRNKENESGGLNKNCSLTDIQHSITEHKNATGDFITQEVILSVSTNPEENEILNDDIVKEVCTQLNFLDDVNATKNIENGWPILNSLNTLPEHCSSSSLTQSDCSESLISTNNNLPSDFFTNPHQTSEKSTLKQESTNKNTEQSIFIASDNVATEIGTFNNLSKSASSKHTADEKCTLSAEKPDSTLEPESTHKNTDRSIVAIACDSVTTETGTLNNLSNSANTADEKYTLSAEKPDSKNDSFPSTSGLNKNLIEYENLSIQSSDIILDSPVSSFYIPSPISSINSPVVFTKKKRLCTKRKLCKIRTTNISEWKDVKRKALKNLGKEHVDRKGDIKLEKKLKSPCTCIKKCSEKIDQTKREYIFKCYWELGSHERQWDFISKYVSSHEPKRIKAKGPNRSRVLIYSLPKKLQESVIVCRTMFLNTLSISEKTVRTLFNKQSNVNENVHKITDLRGRHRNRPNKLGDNILNSVKDHINALAPVDAHYGWKYSTKKYLDGQLSYKRLHSLYLEWFNEQKYGNIKATLRQYQDIVNSNFNIAFYIPKKDQCDKCHSFKNIKEPTEQQKIDHEKHIKYKNLARSLKEIDKREAENSDGKTLAACFDMQKILTCPHGDVSIFYYKRKLKLYNFTVYDMAQKVGFCYMWTEINGKKGANEISSGLMLFIQPIIDKGTKHFKFWSDNCSGQNRNRIVFALYQYLVTKYDIESITHRFLEVGHTQNEGDSVHSVIEGVTKKRTIYTPDQWFNLIRWAKTKGEPYRVKEMTINDIIDCRSLLKGKNWKENDDGEKVEWTKVKDIYVSKGNINVIKYKYQLDEEYKVITTIKRKLRGKANDMADSIKPVNSEVLKIKYDKYTDLKSLCQSNIIPEEFQQYFKSLPYNQSIDNANKSDDDIDSELNVTNN